MGVWTPLLTSLILVGAPAPASAANDPIDRRIIVQWAPGTPASVRADARAEAGAVDTADLGSRRFQVITLSEGQFVAESLRTLRSDPAVASATRDGFAELHANPPDDPLFGQLWGLRNTGQGVRSPFPPVLALAGADIDVLGAWDRTIGDPATLVAVLDSGYRLGHPDLSGAVWSNAADAPDGVDNDGNGIVDDSHGVDYAGVNVDAPAVDGDPTDNSAGGGHGVHTAGTVAAQGSNGAGITGVAQRATLLPVRVCGWSVTEQDVRCPISSLVAGINYAGKRGVRVANLSLGSTTAQPVVRDVMAAYPGTLFVISAGNDGANTEVPGQTTYPCSYDPRDSGSPVDNVVCVTATNQADLVPGFANWGGLKVDLAAPGTDILSTHSYRSQLDELFSNSGFPYPGWTAGGWVRTASPLFASFRITNDTPTQGNGTTRTVRTPTVSTPWPGPCRLRQKRTLSLGGADSFSYTIYVDGAPVFTSAPTNSGTKVSNFVVSGGGSHTLQARFSYTRNGGAVNNGVWVDDVSLACQTPPGSEGPQDYQYLDGTSMAAPHVTGVVALLATYEPAASVAQLREAVLSTVDPIADLHPVTGGHPVATGGRLDANRAVARIDALVPPDTILEGQSSGSRASFTFRVSGTRAPATLECSLDGAAFSPCSSPLALQGLPRGPHTQQVRAVDTFGNADPAPASVTWSAVRPKKVRGVKVKRKAHKAVVTWRAAKGAEFYRLRLIGASKHKSVKVHTTSKRFAGLQPKQRYRVRIVAVNAAGKSRARVVHVRAFR